MGAIWFLSEQRNLVITGFNKVYKKGVAELWITELNGNSRKLAEGERAEKLETALLDLVWTQFPAIIADSNGGFGANINLSAQEFEEEVE